MKKNNLALVLLFSTPFFAAAQSWPSGVTAIASVPNDSVSTEGDLSAGKILTDLSWASSSSNACFTAGQFPKFQGNHVFYGTTIPAGSLLKIKAIPAAKEEEISLYGYMVEGNNIPMVPNLTQCINCEADYKRDRPMKGKVLTHEREIEFRNPTATPYNIIIGVSAPKGVTQGKFTLQVKTVS